MQDTRVDVFATSTHRMVTTKLVDRVDNQGEPCDRCAIEGRFIDATVYGVMGTADVMAGLCVSLDCCIWCVPEMVGQMDALEAVTVELGDSVAGYDDRMHDQDCVCVHPDAL